MSRDVPDEPSRAQDAELLTAYVDGPSELSTDERHQIDAQLARDPAARELRVAVRGLLDRLRALPPEGTEPDWGAMERSIRAAVGSAVPRPWWRRWTWMVPAMTCVAAALVVLVVWRRSAPPAPPEPVDRATVTTPAPAPAEPVEEPVALWLDGVEVDVDLRVADGVAALGGPMADTADVEADEVGLLPSSDLAWVDDLDDDALEQAERWLAGSKG